MILNTMADFLDEKVNVQDLIISALLDDFYNLYSNNSLSPNEQIDCLGFINTLFRLKHKYLLDYNKEKRSFSRDMQMYHLRKIGIIAKMRIRRKAPTGERKKYETSEEVLEFKSLIQSLNKKMKSEITKKTRMLLDELMRERWTVQEKTNLLKSILNSKEAKFQDLLESEDSEEIITSFLALLDLKRKNEVIVIQERNFGEIIIKGN